MSKSLNDFITEYVEHTAKHGRATEEGNYRLANRSYDELVAALRGIREFGKEGDERLLELTAHEDASVRCGAATHSLKHDESKAISVLEKLSRGTGLVAFDAEMVLQEWLKGDLEIP